MLEQPGSGIKIPKRRDISNIIEEDEDDEDSSPDPEKNIKPIPSAIREHEHEDKEDEDDYSSDASQSLGDSPNGSPNVNKEGKNVTITPMNGHETSNSA